MSLALEQRTENISKSKMGIRVKIRSPFPTHLDDQKIKNTSQNKKIKSKTLRYACN